MTMTAAFRSELQAVVANLEATITAAERGQDAMVGHPVARLCVCYAEGAAMGLSQTGTTIQLRQWGPELIRPFVRGTRREMVALAARWNENPAVAGSQTCKVSVITYAEALRYVIRDARSTLASFQELLAA